MADSQCIINENVICRSAHITEIKKYNMKNSVLKLVNPLLFFGVFLSCNSDPEVSISTNNSSDISTLRQTQLINPLEYIGVAHNIYLEEFTSNLELSYSKGEWNDIEFLSNEYKTQFSKISNDAFLKLFPESNSTPSKQELIYDDLKMNEWFDNDSIDELMLAESVLDEKATAKDKEYTMNLLHDVYNAINNSLDDESAYKELENVIMIHENKILTQNWNSNEDFALGALAVAKYSAEFWKNYDFSKFNQNNFGLASKPKNPRSSIIVGADVAGYVIGGVVGGIAGVSIGSVTLGAGTVAAFLGGKAAGAWGGSAAAATAIGIYDAWSDWFN